MENQAKVVDNTKKAKEPRPATQDKLVAQMLKWTDVEKNIIREFLGIKTRTSTGIRVTGKVKGTGKKIDVHVCKQMQTLIEALPKDKPVDINEWAELAVKKGLQTQQPPARIVAYYKKDIVALGFAVAVN